MPVVWSWHGREFAARLRRAEDRLVREAAVAWNDRARIQVGRQGPPRSKPGESLRRDTGLGQRSIWSSRIRHALYHGGVMKRAWYMAWWETKTDGTRRPWMVRTLRKHRGWISRRIATVGARAFR